MRDFHYNEFDEFSELDDEEFCAAFGKKYLEHLAEQNDSDFEINPPQWTKLLQVLKFFYDLAKKSNGNVEPCQLSPRTEHGGVTAYFTVLDVTERDIKKFCTALTMTSAITIDATLDHRVCISVTVPNVFICKQ